MADTKLFNIKGTVKEYQSGTVTLEKELQTVIENNMNIFFGVKQLLIEQLRMKHWNLSFLTVKMSRLELIGRTAMIKKKRLNC